MKNIYLTAKLSQFDIHLIIHDFRLNTWIGNNNKIQQIVQQSMGCIASLPENKTNNLVFTQPEIKDDTQNLQMKKGWREIILVKNEQVPCDRSIDLKPLPQAMKNSKSTKSQISQAEQKREQKVQQQLKQYQINSSNIDQKIYQASLNQNKKEAINLFAQIKSFISSAKDKNSQLFERQAYVSASLAELYSDINEKQTQKYQKIALAIYKKNQQIYYQELIVLLNNLALRKQKNKKFDKGIEIYKQILQIQSQYYSINDEKKLITQNNLACAYYESGDKQKGKAIFNNLLQKMKNAQVSRQVEELIESNCSYYEKERP